MTVQQLIETLQSNGWRLTKAENDVRHFTHASNPLNLTISGKLDLHVPAATLRMLLRGAQLGDSGDALRGDL